ncbi:Desmethyl-deoxy-podophyllotoxin synthase [Linum perenne]
MDQKTSEFTKQPLIFPIITIFIILLLTILPKRSNNKSTGGRRHLPGPWKLPIIGNLHQLAVSSLPHRRLRELSATHGPLMHLQLGEISTVVVSSAELAREFLHTHDLNFATRPYLASAGIIFYGCRDIAFAPYGEYWKEMRKICAMELLSPTQVRSLRPIMEQEIDKLIQLVRTNNSENTRLKPVNLSRMLTSLGNSVTCRSAFGITPKQEEVFLPFIEKIVEELGGFSLGDLFPSSKLLRWITGSEAKLERLHEAADVILESIITDHVAKRLDGDQMNGGDHEDLVDVLLKLKERNQDLDFEFSNREIKAVITDIFIAGSDTWTVTVEWAISELIKNPEMMKKAQTELRQLFAHHKKVDESMVHELHYLQLVLKETLRLHPPGPLMIPREARETVEIDGHQIPSGTRVIINAWAIGRDPRHWTDPEKFNPERFRGSTVDYKGLDFEFIPFGGGRRVCPGMQYAMTIIRFALASLLYHFDWELPEGMDGEDLDMSEGFGIEVRRKNDLVLVPNLYRPV